MRRWDARAWIDTRRIWGRAAGRGSWLNIHDSFGGHHVLFACNVVLDDNPDLPQRWIGSLFQSPLQ